MWTPSKVQRALEQNKTIYVVAIGHIAAYRVRKLSSDGRVRPRWTIIHPPNNTFTPVSGGYALPCWYRSHETQVRDMMKYMMKAIPNTHMDVYIETGLLLRSEDYK